MLLKYKCRKCEYNVELESENKSIIICPNCNKSLKPKRLILDELSVPKIENNHYNNKIINIIMMVLVSITGISLFFDYNILFKIVIGTVIFGSCILQIICRES